MTDNAYAHMSTNAQVLSTDQTLTRNQIDALARLEHQWVEGRGQVDGDTIEDTLHWFMCVGMHDCVCMTPRPLET